MYDVNKAAKGSHDKRHKITRPSKGRGFENREATGCNRASIAKWRNMFMKSAHIV